MGAPCATQINKFESNKEISVARFNLLFDRILC